MKQQKIIYEGLTFDDVLLQPRKSAVLPREVDIKTKLTKEISISIPFISAAMDTVTESNMAIALAREGGLGIIHKNMGIDAQAEEIDKVKRSESGMIRNPVTVNPDQPIFDALELMKKYRISGIPVIDNTNTFVGILTNRDLRFSPNPKLKIKELMTKENLITAPIGTDFATAEKLLQQYKIEKLPVVDKFGKLQGLITYKDILKKKQHPFASKDKLGRLQVGGAVGVTVDTFDRVEALIASSVDVIVIDTAHGQSKGVIKIVKEFKKKFKDIQLIVGNIATSSAALELYSLGVDAVKVGIGPGSICTTRVVTGVGVPQISAIMDVARALKGKNLPIIADGGIKYTGDAVKAIAAGADSVMIGSLFAGVDESPGEKILLEGRSFKSYRGMGSLGAMQYGSKERYFQDMEDDVNKLVPEGVEGRVPYKGQLSDTILQFVGGLRAAMGYCGVKNIKELKEKTQFIKMTSAGFRESHAHDVIITKESPNYHR
ncbi:MAG: IMP dehydrogenase [Melioribacteraceae bacterium]